MAVEHAKRNARGDFTLHPSRWVVVLTQRARSGAGPVAAGLYSRSEGCVLASARAGRASARSSWGSRELATTDMAVREQEPPGVCGEFWDTSPGFGTSSVNGAAWAKGCGGVVLVAPFLKQGWARQRFRVVTGETEVLLFQQFAVNKYA